MKATIQLTESELKAAICGWLLGEYGISVNASNDIRLNEYIVEYNGDPALAPCRPETEIGAEVKLRSFDLKAARKR